VRSLTHYLWIALIVAVTLEILELVHMTYVSGAEWHMLSTLVFDRLAVSYGVIQVLLGSGCPFVQRLPTYLALDQRMNDYVHVSVCRSL